MSPGSQETDTVKVVTYRWGGRRHVGTVSTDGVELTPLDLGERGARRGALACIEAQAEGRSVRPAGPRLPLAAVDLEAPFPTASQSLVRRAQLPGACEGTGAGRSSPTDASNDARDRSVADRLHQGARVRDRAGRADPSSRRRRFRADRLRGRTRGRHRPRRNEHSAAPRAMDHVWGYTIVNDVTARDVQMRHQQWDHGQVVRHVLPDGSVAGRRRRTRRPRHAGALLGQRANCGRMRARRI